MNPFAYTVFGRKNGKDEPCISKDKLNEIEESLLFYLENTESSERKDCIIKSTK